MFRDAPAVSFNGPEWVLEALSLAALLSEELFWDDSQRRLSNLQTFCLDSRNFPAKSQACRSYLRARRAFTCRYLGPENLPLAQYDGKSIPRL